MRIAKIELNSPAEVENEFADLIFFQGCTRRCPYCFNPELQQAGTFENEMDVRMICQYLYNSFSSVVVLTGGEPLDQNINELLALISYLKTMKRKVLIETSKYHKTVFAEATHVLYCIKTWDIDPQALMEMQGKKHISKVVVTDHPGFNFDGYIDALQYMDGELFYRTADDRTYSKVWNNLYKLGKKYNIEVKEWKKLCLTKKNSMK